MLPPVTNPTTWFTSPAGAVSAREVIYSPKIELRKKTDRGIQIQFVECFGFDCRGAMDRRRTQAFLARVAESRKRRLERNFQKFCEDAYAYTSG